ncbi:MAG: hypothetical protein IAA16_04465 [Candidatus Treponema excrementipullorum]|uniref:Uncharacterized protein n=1 Tax=Candidatus Treponema excrementipullorum TaxID=2838768 RepID=A0A9E2NZ03_9SPIR|nr:hypothetical protein [Candidatus Treponema excrementipullorum]
MKVGIRTSYISLLNTYPFELKGKELYYEALEQSAVVYRCHCSCCGIY